MALDFAAEMLGVARAKLQRRAARQAGRPAVVVLPVQGDALALPLRADACDALVTAFTVRNFADLDGALAEFHRVLRPEGRLASLEITSPTMPVFRTLFRYYFRHVVPLVGAAVAGYGAAYRYLPASVQAFLSRRQLQRRFQAAGFAQVTARPLALGTIALHTGTQVAHPQQQADLVTETVPAHEWDDLVLGLPGAHLLQGAAWADGPRATGLDAASAGVSSRRAPGRDCLGATPSRCRCRDWASATSRKGRSSPSGAVRPWTTWHGRLQPGRGTIACCGSSSIPTLRRTTAP